MEASRNSSPLIDMAKKCFSCTVREQPCIRLNIDCSSVVSGCNYYPLVWMYYLPISSTIKIKISKWYGNKFLTSYFRPERWQDKLHRKLMFITKSLTRHRDPLDRY